MAGTASTKRRRTWLLLGGVAAVALVVGAIVAAQGSRSADATAQAPGSSEGVVEGVVEGGTLTIGIKSDPQGVDAAVVNGVWGYVARALSDSLVFFNPDTQQYDPWLAESWTINDDATEYSFQLRDDVTFNDGTSLTGEVVKANFESLQRTGIHPSARSIVNTISRIEVPDEHSVTVYFDEPNASFLAGLARPHAAIVSEATARSEIAERQYDVDGSGAFYLDSYVSNQQIVLKKRADYDWAPDYFDHSGAAYLDEVVYKIIPETSVLIGAVQTGEVDFIYNFSPEYLGELEAAGLVVDDTVLSPGTGLEFPLNVSSELLQDVRVRQALQSGVDRDELSQIVSNGVFAPATGAVSRSNPYYVDASELLAYDPDRSNALLDEAGWTATDADGIRVKDGQRLTLRASSSTTQAEVLQAQWKRIGVDLVIDPPLAAEAEKANLAGEYDVPFTFHSTPDADILRTNYSYSSGNRSLLPAPNELDALLIEQNTILDREERLAVAGEITELILGDAYKIPLLDDAYLEAYSTSVQGLKHTGLDQLLYDTWVDRS